MSDPLEICIEDLDAPPEAPQFMRCVALPGGQPGLAVSERGALLWRSSEAAACELWVSADGRLMLFRPAGASPVAVRRGGRSLDAPHEKPVVLLDQDQVDGGGKRMRVHFHGRARVISPPTFVTGLARAATAAALGGAVFLGAVALAQSSTSSGSQVAGGHADAGIEKAAPIEVREHPPKPAPPPHTKQPKKGPGAKGSR